MRHLLILVALLLALPTHAMNKCVGANGRITYQQDPCPGTVVRGVPKPPPAEAPAAQPARPVIAEGNTACDRVRQKIAGIYQGFPALSSQQIVEAERMIARTKQEYSYCKW